MITLESVSFQYSTITLFEKFNWSVEKGDSWTILGPSGCGKSTLLSLLAGLRLPSSGTITVNNLPLSRPRPKTGLILQDYGLLPWATVRQNVVLGLELRNFYGNDGIHAPIEIPTRLNVDDWLERLGLARIAGKYPGQISGGQRQRTAIARTLVLQPDLLLMDEPFSSLDAPTRESLQLLTKELVAEQALTLVLVTHSIEEAALLGQKILLLKQPPLSDPIIFDNTGAGQPGFHKHPSYQIVCNALRSLMQSNLETN